MKIEEYLTPSLKEATTDQLQAIGVAAFGSALPYLQSQEAADLSKWMKKLGIKESRDFDRKMFKYIVNWVEGYDRHAVQMVPATGKNGLILDYPKLRVSIDEIMSKAKEYRK